MSYGKRLGGFLLELCRRVALLPADPRFTVICASNCRPIRTTLVCVVRGIQAMNEAKRELNLKKTLWKLAYAKQAVSHILTTCEFYEKYVSDDRHPMYIPLICSICVTYARPFTDNGGVGMISTKFARHAEPKLQRTHDLLLASRMHFYAHTDATLTVASSSGQAGPLQQLQVTVSRKRTPQGEGFSFGYALPEMRLRGIVIPDVRALCTELDRRVHAEIGATMEQLFSNKLLDFKRLLDQARADQIAIPLDIQSIP
jgi:hypothetical protein